MGREPLRKCRNKSKLRIILYDTLYCNRANVSACSHFKFGRTSQNNFPFLWRKSYHKMKFFNLTKNLTVLKTCKLPLITVVQKKRKMYLFCVYRLMSYVVFLTKCFNGYHNLFHLFKEYVSFARFFGSMSADEI